MNSVLPSLVFEDTQDNMLKMDPSHGKQTFNILGLDYTIKNKDNNAITQEMKDWYHTKSSNIDRILSVYQRKKEMISHFVVPMHNDNHFVILDVSLPTDKRPNGQVTLYDYLISGDNAKNLNTKMWWAKYFGIYHKGEKTVGVQKYMGIRYINSKELKATNNSVNSYSTLDHVVGKNTGLCQKSDGYKCGIFTIMTMMMRYHGK